MFHRRQNHHLAVLTEVGAWFAAIGAILLLGLHVWKAWGVLFPAS